jgi:O-antigen/teichoic acid export membrane protein
MWAARAMLVHQQGGYGEMGIYAAAFRWEALILFAPRLLSPVAVPILSERLGANDVEKSRKVLLASIALNAMIAVPAAAMLSLVSPFIMATYGSGFAEGWPILVITVWASAVFALQYPGGQIIAASGRMWLRFWLNAGWGIVLLGSFVLLREKGALGLAIASLIAYSARAVWTYGFAYVAVRATVRKMEVLREADATTL